MYVVYFKTNKKFIHEYPNLSNYVKDLYQTPGVVLLITVSIRSMPTSITVRDLK